MVPLDGYIIVRNLRLTLPLGLDAWGRPGKPQPVVISVRLRHKNIFPAAANDDCSKTTSYSDLCKAVIAAHSKERDGPAGNAIDLAHLSLLSRLDHFNGTGMTLETLCPKGTLRNEGGYGLRSTMHVGQEPSPSNSQVVTAEQVDLFTDLKLACIIGVNAHEREQKQTVVVNLELWRDLKDAAITSTGGTHHSMQTTDLYAARQKLMAEVIEASFAVICPAVPG